MNLDVEAIALSQIQYLVSELDLLYLRRTTPSTSLILNNIVPQHFCFQVTSLSKKNLKSAYSECLWLIERFAKTPISSSKCKYHEYSLK